MCTILEEQSVFQDRLDQVGGLLGRLQNVQNQRLSAPLPQHLSQIPHPSAQEIQLGNKYITVAVWRKGPGDLG